MKKTIFVIGAGRGLGNGVAEKFAQNDFRVVLVSRNEKKLAEYSNNFKEKGYEVYTQKGDVSDFENFNKTFNSLIQQYGIPDVLFFNVGITTMDSDTEINPQILMDRYKTDVVSAYNCIQLVNTKEFQEKNGCILITGGGLSINPYYGYLPLSMDKAALRAMVSAYAPILKEVGIYIATVQITGTIGSSEHFAPNTIAGIYWSLYKNRDKNEVIY